MKLKSLFIAIPLLAIIGISAGDTSEDYQAVPIATTMWANGPVTLTMPVTVQDYSYELPEHLTWSGNANSGLTHQDAEIDDHKATLGRILFYDKNLSKNKQLSCGSCHHQEKGFAEDKATSSGFNGQLGVRNAVSLADLDFTPYKNLFWDDRMSDLEDMSLAPFTNPDELGMDSVSDVVEEVDNLSYYDEYFIAAYGTSEVTSTKIGNAMSHFLRSIAAVNNKLDQSVAAMAGGASTSAALADWSESEKLGREIFQTDCELCHVSIKTDPDQNFQIFNLPHNTGLDLESTVDDGVGGFTGSQSFIGAFKTPSLRNVSKTGPYMHDGRFETLEEVIEFYSEGMELHPNSAFNPNSPTNQQYYGNSAPIPEFPDGHHFTEEEQIALLDFLLTLDDENSTSNPIWTDPFVEEGGISGIDGEKIVLSAYPNPTTDIINIGTYELFGGDVEVAIFNAAGSMVRNEIASGDILQIEKGELIPGNYVIRLNDEKAQTSVKVQFQ